MRADLSGICANAAAELERLALKVRELDGFDANDQDSEDPAGMACYYVFALREVSQHARETRERKYEVREFADAYSLTAPVDAVLDAKAPGKKSLRELGWGEPEVSRG